MNTPEKEILKMFDNEFKKMEETLFDRFEDLYCDLVKSSYEQEDEELLQEYESYKAFFLKLLSDQLINQGIIPKDIPLKYMTSGNTGLPVPTVNI